jgi:hypothetical protein
MPPRKNHSIIAKPKDLRSDTLIFIPPFLNCMRKGKESESKELAALPPVKTEAQLHLQCIPEIPHYVK